MDPAKAYQLCNDCAEIGAKKYDLYLVYWRKGEKVVCDRCKQEKHSAVYRLQEKDSGEPFTLGAYDYRKKK